MKLLLGLIGGGIGGSLSPALHEEEGRRQGLRLHYQLIDTDDAAELPGLLRAVRTMGFAGVNITHPFKQSVLPLLDGLSDEAAAIGAVNTVVREGPRLVGHNTDGAGWAWGFGRALPGADVSHVVLLGAGGAGSACADALLRRGADRITVVDADATRAQALVARLHRAFPGRRAAAATDLPGALASASGLVHATPTGMAHHPGLPFDAALLRASFWLSEVVYVPLETPLLRAARAAGCATMDGGHMTVGQAALAFRHFTGREPDAERMDRHFRTLVRQPGVGARRATPRRQRGGPGRS